MCGPGSNVPYVSLLLAAVEQWPGVCSVQASKGADTVDIVSARGLNWTLLSAASSRRLPRVFKQGLSLKVLRLLQHARQCPVHHATPRIFFRSLHALPAYITCAPRPLVSCTASRRLATESLLFSLAVEHGCMKLVFLSVEAEGPSLTLTAESRTLVCATRMMARKRRSWKLVKQKIQANHLFPF